MEFERYFRALRILLNLMPVKLGLPIFHGLLVGIILMALTRVLNPWMLQYKDLIDVSAINDALWEMVGVAIVFGGRALTRVRTIGDTTYEQLEVLDELIARGHLTDTQRVIIYSKLATKVCNDFQIDSSPTKTRPLRALAQEAIAEESDGEI